MLKLYNTLTRKIEDFKPINDKAVTLYTCGPTVYNTAHIGNLRTYIFEDLLRRTLEYDGFQVDQAMNITDVGHLTSDGDEGEDKMDKGAKREGKHPLEIARQYEKEFFDDMAELNIESPHKILRATDSIPEQIEIIKILESKGFIYSDEFAVYFDTSKLPDYGKLSGQKLADKKTGARNDVVVDINKKNPQDFVLWFFLKGRYADHILHWPSPWGEGFPGWHIECSAISRKLLGQPLDIHTGGVDHIGTHHTNEIAQSEAAFGVPLANLWMHGEFLNINPLLNTQLVNNTHVCPFCGFENKIENKKGYIINELEDGIMLMVKCNKCNKEFSGGIKMAKSGDNFITLNTLIQKGYSPLDYRYLCLMAHYRTQLDFSWNSLDAAKTTLNKLHNFVMETETSDKSIKEYEQKFADAVNDDLNIPRALAIAWELIGDRTKLDADKLATLLKFDRILGLNLINVPKEFATPSPAPDQNIISSEDLPKDVMSYSRSSIMARLESDFAKADEYRKKIQDLGYEVENVPEGIRIKKKQK